MTTASEAAERHYHQARLLHRAARAPWARRREPRPASKLRRTLRKVKQFLEDCLEALAEEDKPCK